MSPIELKQPPCVNRSSLFLKGRSTRRFELAHRHRLCRRSGSSDAAENNSADLRGYSRLPNNYFSLNEDRSATRRIIQNAKPEGIMVAKRCYGSLGVEGRDRQITPRFEACFMVSWRFSTDVGYSQRRAQLTRSSWASLQRLRLKTTSTAAPRRPMMRVEGSG